LKVATNRLHIQAEAQQNSNRIRPAQCLAFENRIVMLARQAKRLG
jgi:hypothetical protein